jgi:hypothetical protein
MVEVLIEEMFGSDRSRPKDYKRAVVVDAEVKRTTKTTLRSGRRGLFKNDLTGPTLLEISGYRETLWDDFLIFNSEDLIRLRMRQPPYFFSR